MKVSQRNFSRAFALTLTLVMFIYSAFLPLAQAQNETQATPEQELSQQPKFRKVEKARDNRYIVVLNDELLEQSNFALDPNKDAQQQRQELIAQKIEALAAEKAQAHNAQVGRIYKHGLKGFAMQMTEAEAVALSQDPQVNYVEEDGEVSGSVVQNNAPWGLDRIDQRNSALSTTYNYAYSGAGAQVYVIDSGIRDTHQEFGGRATRDADFVDDNDTNPNNDQRGNDCHGHGTHVAATIGGAAFGVAKGVRLHAVRVLDCSNRGFVSDFIAGLDWVAGNRQNPAVANLSLSSNNPSQALDDAVRRLINGGVICVVSAGNGTANDSVAVNAGNISPARVATAITVGATDAADNRAAFSNFGSTVDVFAPGVGILSAGIGSNSATATMQGTSMAAPHVTGVAALLLSNMTNATPALVQTAITNSATRHALTNVGVGSPNRLLFSWGRDIPRTYGAILVKWLALGAEFGPLGSPVTDELPAARGGRFSQFQFGFIYWTPQLGANAVYGAIGVKYDQLGREVRYGYPVTDELGTPDGVGRFNHFENGGSIYWTPQTGARAIYGRIREKWASLGWERGFLGYPVTDELGAPDGVGRFTHFQRGSVYWTPGTGAREVHGAIRDKWASLGWERGYGYPVTDELATPDGVGRFNHFTNGRSIYWTPATGARTVYGAIRDKWASLGWERGFLGYPTTDEIPTPDGRGRMNRFQGGAIYWYPHTGAFVGR